MGMLYHSPNAFSFSTAWVTVSCVVHQRVRSFPAQTNVTAVYRHPGPQSPLRMSRKLRSHPQWVKLPRPTMLGWSPRRPNLSGMSLAAAPSSHSCSRAICEQCWVDETCKVTFYVAQPGAPCTPGGRSPSTTSRCLHRRKAVTYFYGHIRKPLAVPFEKS